MRRRRLYSPPIAWKPLRMQPEAGSTPSEGNRVTLCGATIDAIDLPGAVAAVLEWAGEPSGGCRVVVTPNVHHLVLLYEQPALRRAYQHADLVLADGAPLVTLSRRLGRPLPERVAGSDLVPALLAAAPPGLRVFLLGAAPGVGERAVEAIGRTWPGVEVVGLASPAPGFEHDPATNDALVKEINETRTQVLVVGLGAPKQELWVQEHRDRLDVAAALCVGATIDFLAGKVSRAPAWMQRAGLEWLYRIRLEPGRLLGRYAHDGRVFARLALAELRGRPLL
jgi:N-acetylglucosaminyldiphosphoundecaprenol N-acetyl-beta-D-mannosaminyltransferase